MGVSTRQNSVLKVVHPGRYVEIFQQPITAGQLMEKYPRHCIARPDVFQFPWIVVRPESLLVPGKVFYLMPYRTLDKLLKKKGQEIPTESEQQITPTNSLRHRQPDGISRRKLHDNEEYYYVEKQGQEFDANSLTKMEFYESWNKMRRTLDQSQESCDQSYSKLNSSLNGERSDSFLKRRTWERVMNTDKRIELVTRPKSCLSSPDSDRKKLNLKVSFASPVAIYSNRRVSPSVQQGAMVVRRS